MVTIRRVYGVIGLIAVIGVAVLGVSVYGMARTAGVAEKMTPPGSRMAVVDEAARRAPRQTLPTREAIRIVSPEAFRNVERISPISVGVVVMAAFAVVAVVGWWIISGAAGKLEAAIHDLGTARTAFASPQPAAATETDDPEEATWRILKSIEGVAFRTNLLALNAIVEAARADGSATLTAEVRDLARRSAQAAGETAKLIEKAIERIKAGAGSEDILANEFKSIEEASREVGRLAAEISAATGGRQILDATGVSGNALANHAARLREMIQTLAALVDGRKDPDAAPSPAAGSVEDGGHSESILSSPYDLS